MNKNTDLQNDFLETIVCKLLIHSTKVGSITIVGKQLKKFIYIISLAGIGLFVNACTATGYVASEPTYVENERPARPSDLHVWIDGDWIWSNQTHVYVQRAGFWDRPRPGRIYVTGHWQATSRGNRWIKGYWQHQNR
ncbi:MAG: hypothetical protein HXX14_03940 [Bacteroidetes bacterium]|nr:hypothetical protein [Bacteroidota bacterium]